MDIKKTNTTEINLTIDDLREIFYKHFNMGEGMMTISEITKTTMIPGGDPHDADYIQTFSGIKIIHQQ